MLVDLEKGFWLMRSVPGKRSLAWDKTLYPPLGPLCNPIPEN
jgi:hypothetical protein